MVLRRLSVDCSDFACYRCRDSTAFRMLFIPGLHSSFYNFFYMNSRLAPEEKSC